MELESTPAPWRRLPAAMLAAGLLASIALTAAPAAADVGVERVSRSGGVPGDAVELTLGCGFCPPPASFPISLVPIERAPKPHRCGPNAICSPQASGPPRRAPFTFLGWAKPPEDDEGPRPYGGGGHVPHVPRYFLHFSIPELRPGIYTYVIYCDACVRGKPGSLIADDRWRLRVRP